MEIGAKGIHKGGDANSVLKAFPSRVMKTRGSQNAPWLLKYGPSRPESTTNLAGLPVISARA
jgi:hypothetical protein